MNKDKAKGPIIIINTETSGYPSHIPLWVWRLAIGLNGGMLIAYLIFRR
jgi:hypothetical protein